MKHLSILFPLACLFPLSALALIPAKNTPPPNIIVILADDMGYSDIGCYGSEIATPNLDRLAAEGIRFSRFYNAARCCPTRASLLTGLYPHQAGIGGMTDIDAAIPEYQGYLNEHCVTLAEVLKTAGYSTYLSGKWHVGDERPYWPDQRGFDRSYSLIKGAASYFDFKPYRSELWPVGNELILAEDGKKIDGPSEPFYVTDLYTDKAIEYVENHDKTRPFFLYLGYTAPHWPLHALPEDIAKYQDTYHVGWSAIRKARLERLKEIGLIADSLELSDPDPRIGEWEALSAGERAEQAHVMAVYAAMIDRMDQNIGRLLESVERSGYSDNTLILFLSDNGAAPPGDMAGSKYIHPRFKRGAKVGTPESLSGQGRGWANVSNTPFREFKSDIHEAGIATPFIVWFPRRFEGGGIRHQTGHIVDLVPTLCELTRAEYPLYHNGHTIQAAVGHSLLPKLKGEVVAADRRLYFEHLGKRGLIHEHWKLVAKRDGPWELYDLRVDRIEANDLSKSHQDTRSALIGAWEAWAFRHRILPYEEVEALIPHEY